MLNILQAKALVVYQEYCAYWLEAKACWCIRSIGYIRWRRHRCPGLFHDLLPGFCLFLSFPPLFPLDMLISLSKVCSCFLFPCLHIPLPFLSFFLQVSASRFALYQRCSKQWYISEQIHVILYIYIQ